MQSASIQIMSLAIFIFLFVQMAYAEKSLNSRVKKHGASHYSNVTTQFASRQITEYLNRLRLNLLKNWLIPDGNNQVMIICIFNSTGFSDDFRVSSTPKCESAESAALAALKNCMPLPDVPVKSKHAKLTIEFISKADPHGDSKSNVNLRLEPL